MFREILQCDAIGEQFYVQPNKISTVYMVTQLLIIKQFSHDEF